MQAEVTITNHCTGPYEHFEQYQLQVPVYIHTLFSLRSVGVEALVRPIQSDQLDPYLPCFNMLIREFHKVILVTIANAMIHEPLWLVSFVAQV